MNTTRMVVVQVIDQGVKVLTAARVNKAAKELGKGNRKFYPQLPQKDHRITWIYWS